MVAGGEIYPPALCYILDNQGVKKNALEHQSGFDLVGGLLSLHM